MTAEYGSGRFSPIFTSSNVTTATSGGAFSIPQTRTFWLYLMNEAGVSLPSPPVTVTIPAGGRISISFPEANRDTATGYKYCFIVASLTTTLDDAWVVGFWRLFQADSDAFSTAVPIVFGRDEQLVVPPAAVSLPAGLPTGASLVPGMVRLISGGIASGASYYIYYPWLITDPNSPYFRHAVDGDKVIERSPGEYWVRFGNPNFGLFPIGGDISGDTGACRPLVAVDEEFLAQNLLFGANYAAADNTDSVAVSAKGLTVFFGSDTGDDITVGSRFGLNIQVDGFPATGLFDRRIVVRFLGFYDPATGIIDETSGLGDGADMEGIGVDLTQTNAETGFLALSKTLPGNQKAVFKIFPRFRASEIYPPLVQGSVVSIIPILLPQGGVRVPLASIFETSAGGFVAPVGDFGRVVPGDGTLSVLPGLFVVRGHESALQPKQTIVEVTPNTLNQQLAVTQDGRAVVRGVAGIQQLSAGEALLALFDFGTGESVAGPWSNNIVLSGAGGISITATYPVSGAFGQVRSSIAEIGGNTQAHFNPPQVRIYVKQGSTIYRLNSPQPIVIGTTQVFTITSLTSTTVVAAPDLPPFSDFCLFDPPTVVGSVIGGSLPIGTYQVAIAYSFLSGAQCTRIRQTTADGCIPAYRQSLFESNSSEIIQSIELLSTAGLIERTIGGSAAIVPLSGYIRDFLNDLDAAAARSTLGLGSAATREIGTSSGQLRDAADPAYTDQRNPLSHADTHLAGGGDSLGLGSAAFRSIGNSSGQIRDAADTAYTNARTPTTHASTHNVGGTDPIAVFGYLAVNTNSTLTTSNQRQLIDVNAASAAIAITLPSASTVGSGWAVQIRKSDASANLVTISRSGSDTINGATTLLIAVQHQSFILFSLGGTSWGVVAGFPGTLPANSLLGTGATAGIAGVVPSSNFASLIGGVVPSSQLPSYVDDVLEFAGLANFPGTGETGKIYVATGTNVTYRWSGSAYVEISASLALGTTSATAYRGDFGNTAYIHSQFTGNPHGTTKTDIGLGNLSDIAQVDLSTDQNNIQGGKNFVFPVTVGLMPDLSISSYTNSQIKVVPSTTLNILNNQSGSLTLASAPTSTFAFSNFDFDINANTSINIAPIIAGGHYRVRYFGSGTVTTLQGLRLTGLNTGAGAITNLDGACFVSRNDGVGTTVTNLTGGNFSSSLTVASTATTINGGLFTVSAAASSTVTTVRGIAIIASSNTTAPAVNCIGLDINNIGGNATNKYSIKTGTGQAYFGDTTASTSTTTGGAVFLGGAGFAGAGFFGGAVQATQFQIAGTKVIGARDTGWTAPSGTANKGVFASDTATLLDVARRLFSIETALRTHGILGT